MRLGIRAHDTKYAPLDEMVAKYPQYGISLYAHCAGKVYQGI